MMKIHNFILPGILLGGFVAGRAATAAVGYAAVAFSSGYNLVANPLSSGVTNGANEIMTPIEGENILVYNGSTFDYYGYDSTFGGWIDINSQSIAPPSLPPGKGFFLFNPGSSTNIVFTGSIVPGPGSTNAIILPTGYSLVGSPLAATVPNITSAPVSLPLIDGMQILSWSGNGYIFSSYDSDFGGWVDGNFARKPPPSYAIGQGFFIFNPGPPVTWTQSLP